MQKVAVTLKGMPCIGNVYSLEVVLFIYLKLKNCRNVQILVVFLKNFNVRTRTNQRKIKSGNNFETAHFMESVYSLKCVLNVQN